MAFLKQYNTQAALCGHGHRNAIFNFVGVPGVMGRSNLRGNAPPVDTTWSKSVTGK
jgi:hypothetical protein